jgi:hypothetical protein
MILDFSRHSNEHQEVRMIRSAALLLTLALSLAGCSADHVRQGVYDAIKVQNDLQSAPSERVGKPESPDYQTYERMRKEQNR